MTTMTAHTTDETADAKTTELFVRCEEGINQGISGEIGQDAFVLRDHERDLFRVTYAYGDDDNAEHTMRVQRLTELDAALLPFVCGAIDLGCKLHDFLLLALGQEEAEFFADMFFDELGRTRELVLKLK